MHSIIFNKLKYTAPSKWDEISADQLVAFAAVTLKKMKLRWAIVVLVKVMYNIPLKEYFKIKDFQRAQIGPTIAWLFEGNKLSKWVITSFWLPEKWYSLKKTKVYGPGNKLANVTIKEFRYLELYYNAYNLTKKVRYLDQLIATLYRPASSATPDTDIRINIAEMDINRRAEKMARLPTKFKQAILLNYEGCRAFVIGKYPLVFKPGGAEGKKGIYDYDDMIQAVAGGKYGTYKDTSLTLIFPFFEHMSRQIEAYNKSQQK